MISIEEARKAAEAFLDEEIRERFPHDVIIVEERVRDIGAGWLFPYDGRGYVERDDWHEAMAGNVPLIVDKETGEVGFAPD